jgi:hypothetical protein
MFSEGHRRRIELGIKKLNQLPDNEPPGKMALACNRYGQWHSLRTVCARTNSTILNIHTNVSQSARTMSVNSSPAPEDTHFYR